MANIYYGDATSLHTLDGNWNTVANWFLTLGTQCCTCGSTSGTAAGRVPHAGDSVVIVGAYDPVHGIWSGNITTGPTGGWPGPVSFLQGSIANGCTISAGTYSGTVTAGTYPGSGYVTTASAVQTYGLAGGTYTGTVNLGVGQSANSNAIYCYPKISGGIFLGKVNRSVYLTNARDNAISGGTYSPVASCALGAGNILSDVNLPVDPGFAIGGGVFSPVITVTGVP